MEDFSALASRVVGAVEHVRGCLLLSRDGLLLGAYPQPDGGGVRAAWVRFQALGDVERGFVQRGEELWAYVRRGPYAAFAVAAARVRPGILLDQLDRVLVASEEGRGRPEAPRLPRGGPGPWQALRLPEREAGPPRPPGPLREAAGTSPEGFPPAAPATRPTGEDRARPADEAGIRGAGEEEVDRVELVREFGRLLQDADARDEGSRQNG